MEKQAHGFKFEDYIIDKYNLEKAESYTAKWDAFARNGRPISLKASNKKNDIIMGDIFRQADIGVESFHLVIGFWEGDSKDIKLSSFTDIYIIKIPKQKWERLFDKESINKFSHMMDKAGKGNYYSKKDKALWDGYYNNITKEWRNNGYNIITPRSRWVKPEEEKDGGHRVQCAMRYNNFKKEFLDSGEYEVQHIESKMKFKKTKEVDEVSYTKTTIKEEVEDTKYGKKITKTTIEEKYKGFSKRDLEMIEILERQQEAFRRKAERERQAKLRREENKK